MIALLALLALAQPATPGASLRVTVVDQSGAVVVGATVTVTAAGAAGSAPAAAASTTTSGTGVAAFADLAPGRYAIAASFPGFATRVLDDIRLRRGSNQQVAVLEIEKVEAAVDVELDRQQSASDRRGPAFGSALTRDQIDALSDDPATLQQQLQEMAGPGAVIRVDGFEGGALPPKAMIRSIRIARDQFAAEFHSANGAAIEIITQPGVGPIRFFSNVIVRSNRLAGTSPFVPVRGPEQNVNYGIGANGTARPNKSSFFVNFSGFDAFDTPILNAAVPGSVQSRNLNLRAPRRNIGINSGFDQALSLNHTLRVSYFLSHFARENNGVGGYDGPERGYRTDNTAHTVRTHHYGPIGRRAFAQSRAQVVLSDTAAASAFESPTVRVLDSFTSGGAQRRGGDHSRTVNVGTDVDYVRGHHSIRSGIAVDAIWYHSDSWSNYLGTYTFADLDAYVAGRPRNYSQRVGDPNIAYRMFQSAVYIQDDVRVRRNLTVTPGLRYEYQSNAGTPWQLAPRFGVTWAPAASGQLTVRASSGIFYDWLAASTYDQVIRLDGVRQREINVINPDFDPASGPDLSNLPPANRYFLGPDYRNPLIARVAAGIDRSIGRSRISTTYSYLRSMRLARGRNLNAPVGDLRPDPAFANVVEVASDAAAEQHQWQFDAAINPGAMLPVSRGPRVSWRRATVFANYTLGWIRTNTEGPFTVSPTGRLATEWGPATGGGVGGPAVGLGPGVIVMFAPPVLVDIRHRISLNLNTQVVRNWTIAVNFVGNTAPPYTLFTGEDDNRDGIFNDRPDGVGRARQRAAGLAMVNVMTAYIFQFGRVAGPLPPGIGIFGGGGAMQVQTVNPGTARYRLQLFVQIRNATNVRNYTGFSGVQGSRFFGAATAVGDMRKVDFGMNFSF